MHPLTNVKGTFEVMGEGKPSGDGSPEQDIKLLSRYFYHQPEQRVFAMHADVCSTMVNPTQEIEESPLMEASRRKLVTLSSPRRVELKTPLSVS